MCPGKYSEGKIREGGKSHLSGLDSGTGSGLDLARVNKVEKPRGVNTSQGHTPSKQESQGLSPRWPEPQIFAFSTL